MNEPVAANLYLSLSVTWKGPAIEAVPNNVVLDRELETETDFLVYYQQAYGFYFNEPYWTAPGVKQADRYRFLGVAFDHCSQDSSPDLGPARIDLVQTVLDGPQANVLTAHILPLDQGPPADPSISRERIAGICRFIGGFPARVRGEGLGPSSAAEKLFHHVRKIANRRSPPDPYTFFTCVSLCNLQTDFEHHLDQYADLIHSLLFAQPVGLSIKGAKNYLENHVWSSQPFFALYDGPAAVIAISRRDYDSEHLAHFGQERLRVRRGEKPPPQDIQVSRYDDLPEYPPLRYLALPAYTFASVYQENLRYIHWQFDEIQSAPGYALWLIPTMQLRLARLTRLWSTNENLDFLRLPITTDLHTRFVETKTLDLVRERVHNVSASILNALVFTLTVIGLIFGVLQIILGLLQFALPK